MLSPAFNTRKDKKLRVCQQVRLGYDDDDERARERERERERETERERERERET